jgi:signal transduction histidine kinase
MKAQAKGGWSAYVRTAKCKVSAWVLGALVCIFGALCCAGILGAMEMGCYDAGVASYYDTNDAGSFTGYTYSYNAWMWYQNRTPGKNTQYNLSDDFMFCLTDARTGNKLYSNVDDSQAHLVGRSEILENTQGETSYHWISLSQLKNTEAEEAYLDVLDDPDVKNCTIMECYLPEADKVTDSHLAARIRQFDFLFAIRYAAIAGLCLCAVIGILCMAVLLCGAGRKPGDDEVHLCWYDRIPMEISALATVGLTVALPVFCLRQMDVLADALGAGKRLGGVIAVVSVLALAAAAMALCIMAWLLSFARWAKTGRAFQNFLGIRLVYAVIHAVRYSIAAIGLVRPTALAVGGIALANLVAYFLFFLIGEKRGWGAPETQLLFLFGILAWAAVWYFCLRVLRSLQTLREAGERIAAGDYQTPIDTQGMLPVFRRYAGTLSHIGAGMNDAVETRTRSERLKAELITNVSHDLKTPLTSIINYTDLLLQEPLPEKAAEYAGVLSRQGEKLKKLTEDLIDASKASSGAMPCHKAVASLSELCEQALGEYQEKLAAVRLEPVLSLPEEGLTAVFDGRLTWRVLDNLLSNACKYAMPGTRLYLTGERQGKDAVLSVKNISATPLNTTPDELMERFVRGDSSRTSEGSGLGLSIARSLTELQGGVFTLSVDGDLFKAEMRFAAAAPAPQPAAPSQPTPPQN